MKVIPCQRTSPIAQLPTTQLWSWPLKRMSQPSGNGFRNLGRWWHSFRGCGPLSQVTSPGSAACHSLIIAMGHFGTLEWLCLALTLVWTVMTWRTNDEDRSTYRISCQMVIWVGKLRYQLISYLIVWRCAFPLNFLTHLHWKMSQAFPIFISFFASFTRREIDWWKKLMFYYT